MHYDAVIVLCTNIRRIEGGYRPTTYQDHDEFGMLAGEMNVLAASLLLKAGVSGTFLFSTGSSQKTKDAYGPDVPPESEVYSQEFLRLIGDANKPNVILEKKSYNTYSNLAECLQIIAEHPEWKRIAILSARYHIPRIQALWELATEQSPYEGRVTFLSAEDEVVLPELPGVYDKVVEEAYSSEWGKKRLAIEAQGLQDVQDGKYVVTEFQLHKAKAA